MGVELAGLIRASEATGGFVLPPAPVRSLGLDNLRNADMSPFAARLVDMHALLAVLADEGALDQSQEKEASSYFSLQDQGGKTAARPRRDRPLALVYLQTVGLLDVVLSTFTEVYAPRSRRRPT